MFRQPTVERLADIMDMVPEMISVFSNESKGYSSRIAKMGEYSRIGDLAKELGIKLPFSTAFSMELVERLLGKNKIPDFAVVEKVRSGYSRFRMTFGDSDTDAVIALTRDFGDLCIQGQIYIYQQAEVSERQIKRMKASGAQSFYHINKELFTIL